jgi:hypothetical protein
MQICQGDNEFFPDNRIKKAAEGRPAAGCIKVGNGITTLFRKN